MAEENIKDTSNLPKNTQKVIFGTIFVVVLAVMFRHSAIVRDVALFIFSVPLGILGWIIGKWLRDFTMPDFVITSGGFEGLLKTKLFWMAGPQLIGALVGLGIAGAITQKLFPPPLPPLPTETQSEQSDTEQLYNGSIVTSAPENSTDSQDLTTSQANNEGNTKSASASVTTPSSPATPGVSSSSVSNATPSQRATPTSIAGIGASQSTISAANPQQTAIPQGYSVSREYVGSYSCSNGVTDLDLKVLSNPNDPTVQYAIFSFGPPGTDIKNAPQGSYLMSGIFDLASGNLGFRPVSWIKEPLSFTMVGMSGNSEDGGTTISGVINFPGCGNFQISNVANSSPSSVSNTAPAQQTPPSTFPPVYATTLYMKTVYDCRPVQLAGWQHPVRNILQEAGVKIDKVQLCNDAVYPVFTVQLPYDPSSAETYQYYDKLFANIAAANGWWSYALVDESDDVIITVTITKQRHLAIDYESFSN